MKVPQELEARVRRMVEEIGYARSAWFCSVGTRSMKRWFSERAADPTNGNVALLLRGVARWESAKASNDAQCAGVWVPPGTTAGAVARN